MFRKTTMALICCLIWSAFGVTGCGGAQTIEAGRETQPAPTEAPAMEAPSEPPAPEKAFLWRATKSESEQKTIYLLGSVHVANEGFYPLDPIIEEAYAASDVLVVEVDTTAISPQEQMQLVLKKASLPAGKFLKDQVSAKTLTALEQGISKFNLQYDQIKGFKPWFAGMTFVMLRIAQAGFRPEMGIDMYFLGKGEKKVTSLETAESQLALFDDMDPKLEELFLLDALEAPLEEGDLKLMMDSWAAGDAAQLEELIFKAVEERPEFGALYERVFDKRNHAMAEGILELLGTHDTLFVVVGAGHMVGEEGLVAIFENKGYALTQLEKKEVKNGLPNSSK